MDQSQKPTLGLLSVVSRDRSDRFVKLANESERCSGGPATGTCGQVPFVLSCVNGIKTLNMLFDSWNIHHHALFYISEQSR